MKHHGTKLFFAASILLTALFLVRDVNAAPFLFSTGTVTNQMGAASRPGVGGKIEIEAADDFPLLSPTIIDHATFTGLITGSSPTVGEVRVEIYRIFPTDSDTGRLIQVPTRANSPSDVEFADRDSAVAGQLTFNTTVLSNSFTAQNSVLNGINKSPNQTTLGEGQVSGQEVQFNITFTDPFNLPADHYFFIPQVQVTGGEFYWLSGSRPIVPPGTPFPVGITDLQSWIRNENLAPDWLRIGTDIVGGVTPPTFNAAFSLSGTTLSGTAVPELPVWAMIIVGLICVECWKIKSRHTRVTPRKN